MFLAKEAVRLALSGVAVGVACTGCPPLPALFERYQNAGGRFMVCPICFDAKQLDKSEIVGNAELAGTIRCRSGSAMKEPPRSATTDVQNS